MRVARNPGEIAMRRMAGSLAVAAMTLVAGCAQGERPSASTAARQARPARSSAAVPCTTTDIGIANVSRCGSGGYGVATE